ncbi:MAG TPA: type II toxin-antitoxin system HicB family antitoxin [Chloroflexota bacterium]|nr:type II toxin-antitoxin system HicB family antitoxin [Chloroflexota bacterium]
MEKYRVLIEWSDEDGAYVARAPELPGCSAWGNTYEQAAAEIQAAMGLWLRTARELGRSIPEPVTAASAA